MNGPFFADEAAPAPPMVMLAAISPCGTWRYSLTRIWDHALPILTVAMLNPSKADAKVNDPTILRLIAFAKRWGFGGLHVVNMYAYRASDPAELVTFGLAAAIGPDNERYTLHAIRAAAAGPGWMLAAWGNTGQKRSHWFIQRCKVEGLQLRCLGLTNSGAPKHPLARGKHRVPDDFQPIPFAEAA
jgi:hypothetical protein